MKALTLTLKYNMEARIMREELKLWIRSKRPGHCSKTSKAANLHVSEQHPRYL